MSLNAFHAQPIPSTLAAKEFGANSSNSLPIPLIAQHGRNWCWAACAEMIERFRNPIDAQAQCTIVSIHTQGACCGQIPPSDACDRTAGAELISRIWHALGHSAQAHPGPIPLRDLNGQLSASRAVQVGCRGFGGGHVVLVVGVDTARNLYEINDPSPQATGAKRRVTGSYLRDGMGMGRWTNTWTNL